MKRKYEGSKLLDHILLCTEHRLRAVYNNGNKWICFYNKPKKQVLCYNKENRDTQRASTLHKKAKLKLLEVEFVKEAPTGVPYQTLDQAQITPKHPFSHRGRDPLLNREKVKVAAF